MSIKLYPKTQEVNSAKLELGSFIHELESKYKLTYGEIIKILGSAIAREAKYLIRVERHPNDPDKKGDEA